MVGNEQSFISNNYNVNSLQRHATSGSTGVPIKCYKSQGDIVKMGRELWKCRNWHAKILPSDKYVTFFIRRYDKKGNATSKKIIQNSKNLSLSLLDMSWDVLDEYCKAIEEFSPKWIFAPPSAIIYLSNFIKKNKVNYKFESLEFIELTGEYVEQQQQLMIEQVFGCSVTNMYGTKEMWGVAYQCPNGHLHLMEQNVHMEIINNDVILTSLNNSAMPIIRYKIGDSAKWENVSVCQYPGKCIKLIASRTGTYFQSKGKNLSIANFFLAVNDLYKEFPNAFNQFQIQQHSDNEFVLLFIPGTGFNPKSLDSYYQKVLKFLPDAKLEFQKTDFINYRRNGKISYFIDLQKQNL